MNLKVIKTELKEIQPFRRLFLQENNFQIRYDACHERGWTDSYLLTTNDIAVGYGSIKGQEIPDRDSIFELFVAPPYRKLTSSIFSKLIEVSNARYIECQSNDLLLSAMLYEFTENINSDVILFADHVITDHQIPGVIFRPRQEGDLMPGLKAEELGKYVLELDGAVIATGGFLLHYNMPFADLYMEVRAAHRGKGLGSFILQEIKKECYRTGRVPAARCNIKNDASKATLLKAGFKIVGYMLLGHIKS